MDWIQDFIEGFYKCYEIKKLKADHFYGSIEIYFLDGNSNRFELHISKMRDKPSQTKGDKQCSDSEKV